MNYSILSNTTVNVEESKLSALDIGLINFDIKNEPLPGEYHLIISEDSQFDTTLLSKISAGLAPRGFILLIENSSTVPSSNLKSLDLQVVTVTENNNKKYFLLKKVKCIFEIIILY